MLQQVARIIKQGGLRVKRLMDERFERRSRLILGLLEVEHVQHVPETMNKAGAKQAHQTALKHY